MKKQLLTPRARGLINTTIDSAEQSALAEDRGTRAMWTEANATLAKDKAALEAYVLLLERTRRRLKDEVNRTTAAYKLLLDRT